MLKFLPAALVGGFLTHARASIPREITLHVPFPPGGSPDLLARMMADALRDRMGISVLVSNTSGVNGELGLRRFLQQPPDGSHWLIAPDGLITINPFIFPRSGAEPLQGLAPILSIAAAPQFLLVRASDEVDSLSGLAAAGRSAPIDFGSGGIGAQPHLIMMQLSERLGMQIHHVPYRNNGLAALGVARGEVRAVIAGTSSLGLVRGGKLKIIAVSSAQRQSAWPQVRTLAEDLPGFSAMVWIGLFGSSEAPRDTRLSLTLQVRSIVSDPSFVEGLETRSGLQSFLLESGEFRQLIDGDLARYKRIVSKIGGIQELNRPERSQP